MTTQTKQRKLARRREGNGLSGASAAVGGSGEDDDDSRQGRTPTGQGRERRDDDGGRRGGAEHSYYLPRDFCQSSVCLALAIYRQIAKLSTFPRPVFLCDFLFCEKVYFHSNIFQISCSLFLRALFIRTVSVPPPPSDHAGTSFSSSSPPPPLR